MKTPWLRTGLAAIVAACLVSGCATTVSVEPAGEPVAVVAVPETYVWDGVEFVGVVGGEYYYLGPGEVWLVCEPWRLDRFHGWERVHPDWRDHAIRNDRYRKDRYGHVQPRRDDRPNNRPQEANRPAETRKDRSATDTRMAPGANDSGKAPAASEAQRKLSSKEAKKPAPKGKTPPKKEEEKR